MTPDRWDDGQRANFRARFWRPDVKADVDDEIRFHIEQRTADLVARGAAPGEARERAEQEFGDSRTIREQMVQIDSQRERTVKRREYLGDLSHDLRLSIRSLRRSPAFSAMAIACLALGVCVTTTIFGAVNAILIRPLPFPDPSRLVSIYGTMPERDITGSNISWPDYNSWREGSSAFTDAGIWTWSSMALSGPNGAERVETAEVSASVFPVLGVQPVLGRTFRPEEEQLGNERVILLGHDLWQQRFGGDSSIVGRTVIADARPYMVIGVMPPRFNFPERGQAWTPFAVDPAQQAHGNRGFAGAVARLKPGVSMEAAQAELDVISARLARDHPDENRGWRAQVVGMRADLTGDLREPLLVFLGAVSFVLLIAGANVANLMIARGASRQQETAVRMALGASRGRIVRAVLTESLLLSLVGGLLGLLLARNGLQLLSRAFPDGTPYFFSLDFDYTVALFATGLTVVTALVFGMLPALGATRFDLQSRLRDGTRSSGGRAQGRARRGLVVGEVALSVMLLIAATLLVRSHRALLATDLGFDTHHVLTARFTMPAERYPTDERRRQFADELRATIAALPGVERVGSAQGIPLSGWDVQGEMSVEGNPPRRAGDALVAHFQSVSPEYFATIGTRLLRGRMLSDSDRDTAMLVGVINRTFAETEFAGMDPIGRRIRSGGPGDGQPWVTIVGVVQDVRQYRLPKRMGPAVYYPQATWPTGTQTLVVRTTSELPLSLAPAVRNALKSLDPDVPLYRVQTMAQAVDRSLWRQRLQGQVLLLFAGMALLLAAVGLYGIIAWSVVQRTREVGIRMALGSTRLRVAGLILRDSLKLTLLGIVVGVTGAVGLARLLADMVYGVSVFDVFAFSVVPIVLLAVAGIAGWVPARRAARIDPALTMRAE